jgi:hypothetical protein
MEVLVDFNFEFELLKPMHLNFNSFIHAYLLWVLSFDSSRDLLGVLKYTFNILLFWYMKICYISDSRFGFDRILDL